MTSVDDESFPEPEEESPEDTNDNFFIDILTGNTERATPKKLLVQKVLQQLIETYGFDRRNLATDYDPRIRSHRRKRIDIAIFAPNTEHTNENLKRIVLCKIQKKRDKLRTITEADTDVRPLRELMELIPNVTLGMWTNDHEEFLLQVEHTRFEARTKPLAVWPVPGEDTSDLERTGGVIQISADATGLEAALSRCWLYLASNQNIGLGDKAGFQQLALLLFAKVFDETRPSNERQFWIRGDEPFTPEGQQAIQERIRTCIQRATDWRPNILEQGWMQTLHPDQTARVAAELARYSFAETQPRNRTFAFRAIARNIMDGREGRYPTPLNVAELAVQMLDPKPNERILDCAVGTGTFLAVAATHVFKHYLAIRNTTPEEAAAHQVLEAQTESAHWVSNNVFGCDIDPFLVVATRMNLLFTIGNAGQIFRLDARTFPSVALEGERDAARAMPLGTMDLVVVNPWFSTQDKVTESSILERYDLGKIWEPDESHGYRNTGNLNSGGVPPEVIFLERALQWVKPGTGRIAILLPDGLLGNLSDEFVRFWILRHCEVLASIDLPLEPFKVTVSDYGLTPALASLLILRRRSPEEALAIDHPEYRVFMAVVGRAGVDARGKLLFHRAPDGDELIFDEEVIERVREAGVVHIRRTIRRRRRIHDDLPLVAEKYKQFRSVGEVT